MKAGSLVVIKHFNVQHARKEVIQAAEWLPVDDEKTIYTVRALDYNSYRDLVLVFLEEGVIGHSDGTEIGLNILYVREVQPPEELDIQAIMDESILETA